MTFHELTDEEQGGVSTTAAQTAERLTVADGVAAIRPSIEVKR